MTVHKTHFILTDTSGETSSTFYKERLRLRKVERILFQELEFYADDLSEVNHQLIEPSIATAESSVLPPLSDENKAYKVTGVPIVFTTGVDGQWRDEEDNWTPSSRHSLSRPMSNKAEASSPRGNSAGAVASHYWENENFEDLDIAMADGDITSDDIDSVVRIQNPDRNLMLAGAAILILLTEGTEVPADISWESFRELASFEDIAWDMNSLVPSNIPRFKVRAIRPFISHLENYAASSKMKPGSSSSRSVWSSMKIIKWVISLMKNAINAVLTESPKKSSKTDKLLASVMSYDSSNPLTDQKSSKKIIKKGKPPPLKKPPAKNMVPGSKSSEKVKSKPNLKSSLTNKKTSHIPKIEKNMCTLYSELVDNIFERPLFLTLLGPSFLLSDEMGEHCEYNFMLST